MKRMKNIFMVAIVALGVFCGAVRADTIAEYDTSDPLYILSPQDFLSSSDISYYDSVLRIGQTFSYGVMERFNLGVNANWQNDFHGDQDGFSAFDFGGLYRVMATHENSAGIVADVLAGFKFGGASRVRSPWFADSTYYAGMRFGRQWETFTLAGTIKSSWIFDDKYGLSYIDFIPEAYFRLRAAWRMGIGADIRKSTNSYYDQEWLNLKLLRQYGRTQYIGHVDYEFEDDEWQFGFKLNILF